MKRQPKAKNSFTCPNSNEHNITNTNDQEQASTDIDLNTLPLHSFDSSELLSEDEIDEEWKIARSAKRKEEETIKIKAKPKSLEVHTSRKPSKHERKLHNKHTRIESLTAMNTKMKS